MELQRRLSSLAAELAEVSELTSDGQVEYRRGDAVFAAVPTPSAVELRVGAEIADAARRTPDTIPSSRGEEWVHFAPAEWDKHAADRLEAWFQVAWRTARNR
ncbi:MAG TPA: hypothetical protein VM305_08080 [Candidatus Limnocylindrales bacterium]|nr:hypothetical protein [Candidatus Limnocylindrales bacterium]